MSNAPWDFGEAKKAARQASQNQAAAEGLIKQAAKDYALADQAYRLALAKKILELHADGVAWTSTGDLARGDKHVTDLKVARDIAEGVKDAATHAAWRASNDRQDTQRFIEWSRRRDLAEAPTPESFEPVIGSRA